MDNTLNLDPVIRKVTGTVLVTPGETVIVTIDRGSKKAVKKDFLLRVLGDFHDYLVANKKNPLRTARGKPLTYYVCDNQRTVAIDIVIIAAQCPVGHEQRVAEALHGEHAPGQILAGLLQRWVNEFIPSGDEARFIENYDAVRHQLEKHLVNRAAVETGLELKVQVALSGENNVASEIVVGPIEIGVRLQGYTEEQKITVEAGLNLDPRHYVKAYVFNEKLASAEEVFKRRLKDYFFHHVTFRQFTYDLQYPAFKQPLLQKLSEQLRQVGRNVRFINISTNTADVRKAPREFVAVTHNHEHFIPGRSLPVIIQNTVQLYCHDSVAFLASRVTDLEAWVRDTLNVNLKRHLIGKTYVDLLLRFASIESNIKRDVSACAAQIGYRVDHLVSVPNLKAEEEELTNPFLLEAEDTFETSLDKFEVQLKFNIRLYIPKLDSIERYLNPGTDVKEAIRQTVLREARHCLRSIHPERFYLYFNQPNKAAPLHAGEDDGLPVKELLSKKIQESLKKEFNARIVDLTQRVGRSDLTERYHNLCFVIREFRVSIDSPNPQATEELVLTGNFELRGVYPDEEGWRRFSVLQLDLDGLQYQLEIHLKSELKTYYQYSFMYQNAVARNQVFSLVRNRACAYMRQEFGLIIHLTNLDRNTTKAEEDHRNFLIEIENKKLESLTSQSKLLVTRLEQLRVRRARELSVSPVDKETLKGIDENIEFLEKELKDISSATLRQSHLATVLVDQLPDELPPAEESQLTEPAALEAKSKAQLTS
jgi:hypothetical protein